MPRILAIEPDATRRVTLGRLVNEHLGVEVVLAASAGDALLTLVDVPPDVILTSTLLPADEDEQLNAHLRAAPDLDHLPVLTIPPVVEIANQPGRQSGSGLACSDVVGSRSHFSRTISARSRRESRRHSNSRKRTRTSRTSSVRRECSCSRRVRIDC